MKVLAINIASKISTHTMIRASFVAISMTAAAVSSQIIMEKQCTDSNCQDCVQLENITTGKCYDDPQEGDLFVVAGCNQNELVENFYSDDQCQNQAGKKHVMIDQCVGPDLNHNYHYRQCVSGDSSSSSSSFAKASANYVKEQAKSPMVKYSFTFTGDGDGNQAPKFGCFEQDNGCKMCLQAWWNYPPDASYKYEPIVDHGCTNGTLQECDFCPPGLTLYQ